MKDIFRGLKGIVYIAGIASIVSLAAGAFYADRKLHETSHGHKYGPARHMLYFSDILHRFNREISNAAVSAYSNASKEDALFYDSLQDAHDELAEFDDPKAKSLSEYGPDPSTVINDPVY